VPTQYNTECTQHRHDEDTTRKLENSPRWSVSSTVGSFNPPAKGKLSGLSQ